MSVSLPRCIRVVTPLLGGANILNNLKLTGS
jgi:hypothetical protein